MISVPQSKALIKEGRNSSPWNILKLLGQGSYGTVYLAQPTTGPLKFAALKVALLEKSSSLMREKEILENFRGCPEIIQCFGGGIYDGPQYSLHSVFFSLVVEYAPGGTLSDLIKQQQKLPEHEVKQYLKMILKGLSCIHSKGFVHSDLKPDNILVFSKSNGEKQLKIADFGMSRRCEKLVKYRTRAELKFRGTPNYMSPESVVFGDQANASLDIWSLGCILVEMVSGKSVWSACKNQEELMKKLVFQMEIPDIPEELSREGRDFLAGCFDHNFDRRWTAEMLLDHPYVNDKVEVDDERIKPLMFKFPKLVLKDEDAFEEPSSDVLPSEDELLKLIGFQDFIL